MEEQQQQQRFASNNSAYNTSEVIRIRLDTSELIDRIECFLRGKKLAHTQDEDGNIRSEWIQIGEKRANENGIQSIINWVSSIINPHNVQGNFYCDRYGNSSDYDNYILEVNVGMIELVFTNIYKWDIKDEHISEIIDFIMNLTIPFMSRLKGNEERKSYADTMTHSESSTISDKKGFLSGLTNR